MQFAMVNGKLDLARPGKKGSCPACGGRVLAKTGEIISWHWAHEVDSDCLGMTAPQSEWLTRWKSYLPYYALDPGPVRQANMALGGLKPAGNMWIFVYSDIPFEEILDLRTYWGSSLRWVVNATDKDFQLEYNEKYNSYSVWRKSGWPTLPLLAAKTKIYLDLGDDRVLGVEHINESGSWAAGPLDSYESMASWIDRTAWMQPADMRKPSVLADDFCEFCAEPMIKRASTPGQKFHPECEPGWELKEYSDFVWEDVPGHEGTTEPRKAQK